MPKPRKFYSIQLKRNGEWGEIPYPGVKEFAFALGRAKGVLLTNSDVEEARVHTFTHTTTRNVARKEDR